jgi:hypothetical protein
VVCDTTQVLLDNIQIHDNFCNVLKTRMNWSKNVQEERDAPFQIVLGCMDTLYCVLTSLALWLELQFRMNPNALLSPYAFAFNDDTRIPEGGLKSKQIACRAFSKVFRMSEMGSVNGAIVEGLGSHSIRKFSSTTARKAGITKDEKEIRGRWKAHAGGKRVSDVYDDVELPYPDAKVAQILATGGPCYYLLPEEVHLTNTAGGGGDNAAAAGSLAVMKTFLLSRVVPNIRKRLSDEVCFVLGKALMWLIYSAFDAEMGLVPEDFKERIKMEWNEIVTAGDSGVDCNDERYNPVRRVPVVVTGDQGLVYIDVIQALDGDGNEVPMADAFGGATGIAATAGGGGVTGMATRGAGLSAQLLALQSMTCQIRRELQEMRMNQLADRVTNQKGLQLVNANIRRIAIQPAVRTLRGTTRRTGDDDDDTAVDAALLLATAGVGAAPAACLSPNPKNLFEFWAEFQVGIGGRKPAKLFSSRERGGKTKYKYHRRLVVWRVISGLIRQGMTADAAIDCIYSVYGHQTSVTSIINSIRKEKGAGTLNPNLRV